MNKGKKSFYNAITAFTYTLINGLLGLVVIRLVIATYGSDFNGLNSTANQFINMLLILEGGFTLATNVALFKPFAKKDYKLINEIMTATRNIFIRIGIIFLAIGIIASIGYALVVKSSLPIEIAALTFIMTVIASAFNLLYATKFSILLQTEQREYILNIIKICTIFISQFLIILVIFFHGHMLLVRFATMVGSIINSLLIGYVCKRSYKFLSFKETPNYLAIKGTKDVFAQKMTGMIYGTAPIILISATAGTMIASVYAVYDSIFLLIRSIVNSITNAPRMGFGQLIVDKDKNYVYRIFNQYQHIVIMVVACLLSTTAILIMPFIKMYTLRISDINYENWYVAYMLIAITFFELIHIPSGNILNMAGHFKVSKNFQSIACVVLIIVMILGSKILGFYGILVAVLVTAILLAIMEITYIQKIYFKSSIFQFLRLLLPNFLLSILLAYAGRMFLPSVQGYLQFIIYGIILVIINGSLIIIFNFIVNKTVTLEVVGRLRPVFKKVLCK